jgi:hypothetical protein
MLLVLLFSVAFIKRFDPVLIFYCKLPLLWDLAAIFEKRLFAGWVVVGGGIGC